MKRLDYIKEQYDFMFDLNHMVTEEWSMDKYHIHDCYEILFSLTDSTSFFVEDTIYDVKRGDIFILNNKELHRTVAFKNKKYERYICSFSPEFISEYSTEKTDLLRLFTKKHEANRSHRINLIEYGGEVALEEFIILLKKIEYYTNCNLYGSDVYVKLAFIELLLYIDGVYGDVNKRVKEVEVNINHKEKTHEIIKYLNNHYEEELSLDVIAKNFFISKYYLSHVFKKNTGFTINEYIVNRRILKAKELLKQNNTVSEVSDMVGFKNYCHFIRSFKKATGISPKQYAKRYYE